MEITSIMEVWKIFRWLPDFILKRVFSKRRLSELIYIDVKPRGESVRVDVGQPPIFEVWLQLINMTPFEVELDRAELEMNFSGIRVKYKHLKKTSMQSGEILDLFMSDSID